MRGEGNVAGEGRVVGIPIFHSWSKSSYHAINKYVSAQIGCSTLPLACVLYQHAGPT